MEVIKEKTKMENLSLFELNVIEKEERANKVLKSFFHLL